MVKLATPSRNLPDLVAYVPGTHAEFRKWVTTEAPERGRFTYVNGGVFIDMSPERIEQHVKIKQAVNLAIGGMVRDEDLGEYYPDGALVTNVPAGLSNEPDASFASWETLESGRLREVPRHEDPLEYLELEGTPDWVCEIVCPTSVRKDTQLLVTAYYEAGIPEYWLIDATGDAVEFRILVRGRTGYVAAEQAGEWRRSSVFGRDFHLERRRDRRDRWAYRLHQRPLVS